MQDTNDIPVAIAKVAPSATVGFLAAMGISLSDVLIFITILYTVTQFLFLVRDKWWRDPYRKNKRKEDKDEE